MAETKMSVFICDGCHKIDVNKGEVSYEGTALAYDGTAVPWYACKATCIRKAVVKALKGVGDVAGASSEA